MFALIADSNTGKLSLKWFSREIAAGIALGAFQLSTFICKCLLFNLSGSLPHFIIGQRIHKEPAFSFYLLL